MPGLTPKEASEPEHILYDDVFDSDQASFRIVKLTGGGSDAEVTVKITAFTASDATGSSFFGELGGSGDEVNITAVYVNGVAVDPGDLDLSGNSAVVSGVQEGDVVTYTTDGNHNQVLIENFEPEGENLAFSIAGFELWNTDGALVEVGSSLDFYDDGPSLNLIEYDGGTDGSDSVEEGGTIGAAITLDGGADGVTSVDVTYDGATKTLDLGAAGSVSFGDTEGLTIGDLTVSVDGSGNLSWSFAADPNSVGPSGDSLSFTVTAADGDTDTVAETHTINVIDSTPQITTSDVAVDEDGLVGGAERPAVGDDAVEEDNDYGTAHEDSSEATATGQLSITDDDTPLEVTLSLQGATVGGSPVSLKSGGATVDTVFVGGTLYGYTGTAPAAETPPETGQIVFTVALNGDGTYTYTQVQVFDYPLQDDPATGGTTETAYEDNIVLSFGVDVTDALGNTASDSFTVNADDDTPSLEVDNLVGSGTTAEQVSFWTGDAGADGLDLFDLTLDSYYIGTALGTGTVVVDGPVVSDGDYAFTVTVTDDFTGDGEDGAADGWLVEGLDAGVDTLVLLGFDDINDTIVLVTSSDAGDGDDVVTIGDSVITIANGAEEITLDDILAIV